MQDASSVDEVVKRVHRAMEKVEDMASVGNRNSQNFTLQTSSPVAWICVLVAVIAVMFAGFSLNLAADARAQGRADRQELLDEIRALKDDTKGIRAYINTGILKPLPEDKRNAE